jgi:(S)-mandelate dehydrogenase
VIRTNAVKRAVNLDDFRAMARRKLPRIAFDFIDGGADDERCLQRNRDAFAQHALIPRYLVDVSHREQSVTVLGRTYASPIGIAPTGLAGLFREGADGMLAAAARDANVPFLLSSASNIALEDAARIAPANVWFQMYCTTDERINRDLVRRAGDAGIGVLVISVDVPAYSNRERNRRNGFSRPLRMTPSVVLDALGHPGWVLRYVRAGGLPMLSNWQPYAPQGASPGQVADLYGSLTPAGMTDWRTLEWIRAHWRGPLVIKGLLHPDDAVRAAELGAEGVIVSNHGGRQLDAAPSPLAVLPLIRDRVGPRLELMLDSGVRRGSDIVIARCLGASACFVGRPTLFAVAAGGQPAVDHALRLIRNEVDVVLAQIGCPRFEALGPQCLQSAPHEAPAT